MLLAIDRDGQYSHLVLRDVLDKYQYLSKQERAFLTRLTEGTVERMLTLDYVIDQFSKTKVKKMKPLIRELMRLSVYQIMYMDGVPDSAVCNEAVKLARKRGFSGLSGFVNGVLRSVARGWKDVTFQNESVRYSVPEWIIDGWNADYGRDVTDAGGVYAACKDHGAHEYTEMHAGRVKGSSEPRRRDSRSNRRNFVCVCSIRI